MTSEVVNREVDRLLALQDARREAGAEESEAHIARCLERRIRAFENGKLGMCNCRNCLTGYVARDIDRMCATGQWQFWQEANRWRPHVL